MNSSDNSILFVDDEINILQGFQRQLRSLCTIETASSGERGLEYLRAGGHAAVVVSDMRMPGMSGIDFLAHVREEFPHAVRIMLTGYADLESAIKAVNEGNIFRFITKPCDHETLANVLNAALEQYHLLQAERELLEKTLQGSIDVLVDILSLTTPSAFSRARRMRHYARQLAADVQYSDIWRIEVAALLSQIGCMAIPSDVLEKFYSEQPMTHEETRMMERYPRIGHDLLINIPRLEAVAEIIARQLDDFPHDERKKRDGILVGASILRIALDFDTFLLRGRYKGGALHDIRHQASKYNPELVAVIQNVKLPAIEKKIDTIPIDKIRRGMYIEEELVSKRGVLIAKAGQEVTPTMRVLLENYHAQGQVKTHVLVGIPIYLPEEK